MADLEEATLMADETGQMIWKAAIKAIHGLLAGARDDDEAASRLAAEAEEIGLF
jgi:ATP/maltotriose-dependent transcriptional regulator MalT